MAMILIGRTRYRHEDAVRLGLIESGVVLTAKSVEVKSETVAPDGLITSAVASAPAGAVTDDQAAEDISAVDKPGANENRETWVGYALANGKTEKDLEGLGRNKIAALFKD